MTPFVTFSGYSAGSQEVTIAAARVTHFHYVGSNGKSGTCIYLDTDKEIFVGEHPSDVEKALAKALKP